MNKIEEFVEKLAKFPVNENVANIYNNTNKNHKVCKENLRLYLQKMKSLNPEYALIGEAPGFKGCGLTGIPFTSEYLLFNSEFFQNNGYKTMNDHNNLSKESTATIVWGALDIHKKYPLLWNAFPFHPHKKNNPNSNRSPNKVDIEQGFNFLREMFGLFPNLNKNKVGAIGRVSEDLLKNKLKFSCSYITHPSFGRKVKFMNDINKFFEAT